MDIQNLTGSVIESAIKIHSKIRPGCFEKVYEELLYYELHKKGLQVERQLLLPIGYEELYITNAYKVDLLVEKSLLIELNRWNMFCLYILNR